MSFFSALLIGDDYTTKKERKIFLIKGSWDVVQDYGEAMKWFSKGVKQALATIESTNRESYCNDESMTQSYI